MLAISPLRSTTDGGHRAGGGDVVEGFSAVGCGEDNFSESFSGGNLLEDIDFDDLFVGFDDGDVLPDLEVDPNEILAEFSVGGEDESSGTTSSTTEVKSAGGDVETSAEGGTEGRREEEGYKGSPTSENMEAVEMEDDGGSTAPTSAANSGEAVAEEGERGRSKSAAAAQAKGSQGKRKVKVDWTADLHRRFVQAVEQLGVDKAVPSRILEIMGIDCLTRHNIASHLQKYRSHRKHLLAREAEAASWSQRRHMYGSGGGGACAAAVAAGGKRGEMAAAAAPWLVPTIGFPPPPPPAHAAAAMQAPFRPLHVWGHPTVDHAMMHMWPKHLVPSRTPPAAPWAPPQAPPNPAFWHHHHLHYPRPVLPSALTQGTPCFPSQPLPPQARYPAPPVPGIPPPHPMYKVPDIAQQHPAPGKQLPQFDLHPSKESIDAALGDVLSKPWLPLPLGLKPPSVDSVLGVLQRQGISKIPPSCA